MHTPEQKPEWEKEFDEKMYNLPVNDYRVYTTDLITNIKRPTLRGETIKDIIRSTLHSELERYKYKTKDNIRKIGERELSREGVKILEDVLEILK